MRASLRALYHELPRRFAGGLLNTLFPEGNICHLCGCPLQGEAEVFLCDLCAEALLCAHIPNSDQPLSIHELLPCAVAAYLYHSPAQELVHNLKYRGDATAAAPLAQAMARAFACVNSPELRRAELLIPIPLHPRREESRGFNQAALIAECLSGHIGLAHYPRALERIRYTRSQVNAASRERRLKNMIGAFTVADIPLIYKKHVLLVDDVCTTGATAIACAHVLLACGAKEVSLLTACRA